MDKYSVPQVKSLLEQVNSQHAQVTWRVEQVTSTLSASKRHVTASIMLLETYSLP